MKRTLLILSASIAFLMILSSARASHPTLDSSQWGRAVDGLQMSLASTNSTLEVALRNTGDHDVTLNLGEMMANGKALLPGNISLNFTDARGNTRLFKFADKRYPGVAGRLDDYVVPLRAGSTYTLELTFDQFWCDQTKEFSILPLPGTNRLTARFEGTGARLVNEHMPATSLMNFWLGNVESNTVTVER